MKPTTKSKEMNAFLDTILPHGREESIRSNVCAWCGKYVEGFKDALSVKEYRISGFCQACQDNAFKED